MEIKVGGMYEINSYDAAKRHFDLYTSDNALNHDRIHLKRGDVALVVGFPENRDADHIRLGAGYTPAEIGEVKVMVDGKVGWLAAEFLVALDQPGRVRRAAR